MHYQIEAYLVRGNPRLRIKEAESGAVRLVWDSPKRSKVEIGPEQALAQSLAAEEALQKLFRSLFLLTTAQYLNGQLKDD